MIDHCEMEQFFGKVDNPSLGYGYSPLPSQGSRKPSPYSHIQSLVRSPVIMSVIIISLIAATGFGAVLGGGGIYFMYCNHTGLMQDHRVNTINMSNNDYVNDVKQNLSRCLHVVEAINSSVSLIGPSKEHFHQLKDDIKRVLATYNGKNESLIPHHRRRPPVEAWNTTE